MAVFYSTLSLPTICRDSFMTCMIMSRHSFLPFIALRDICLFTVSTSVCSAMNLHKLIAYVTRCFPLCFACLQFVLCVSYSANTLSSLYIPEVLTTAFWSKYPFSLICSFKSSRCSQILSIVFSASFLTKSKNDIWFLFWFDKFIKEIVFWSRR